MSVKPLVAIHCLVYNHELYLRECLEGIVMQQTNFPFVAIIHDDASSDASVEIIREYEHMYPHVFKPIYEKENQYLKGGFAAIDEKMNYVTQQIGAKYVAMCEGDDYWVDPWKLQKQVDFLEQNECFVLCCHRYKVFNDKFSTWSEDYLESTYGDCLNGFSFTNKDNFKVWITKTATIMVRFNALQHLPLSIKFKYWRDVHKIYYILKGCKGFCMAFYGAVYRCQENGIFSSLSSINKEIINLKVWNELVQHNTNDSELLDFYNFKHNEYREYLRYKLQKGEWNNMYEYIKVLLVLDYNYKGLPLVLYSCKKNMLSIFRYIIGKVKEAKDA